MTHRPAWHNPPTPTTHPPLQPTEGRRRCAGGAIGGPWPRPRAALPSACRAARPPAGQRRRRRRVRPLRRRHFEAAVAAPIRSSSPSGPLPAPSRLPPGSVSPCRALPPPSWAWWSTSGRWPPPGSTRTCGSSAGFSWRWAATTREWPSRRRLRGRPAGSLRAGAGGGGGLSVRALPAYSGLCAPVCFGELFEVLINARIPFWNPHCSTWEGSTFVRSCTCYPGALPVQQRSSNIWKLKADKASFTCFGISLALCWT